MGILNVTPDSFSDGGRYLEPVLAIEHARRLIAEGADILDVGGESTRPGAAPVSAEEEMQRVLPVIEALASAGCLISIDTTKASVARRAIEAGAHILNDVSALTDDPEMAEVARESAVGVVLMHRKGTARTMQDDPRYDDVVAEVRDYLAERLAVLEAEGVAWDRMVVDPGIGFGKTMEHNLRLLAGLPALCALGRPVLIGASRKSLLGMALGRDVRERLAGTLAVHAYAQSRGARILRVHDVKDSCDAARMMDILSAYEACIPLPESS